MATDLARGTLLRRIQYLLAVLPLAYAILLQPLASYRPVAAYDALDLATNVDNAESNPVNQLFWIALLGLCAIAFAPRLRQTVDALRRPVVVLIAAFIALCFASILWSAVPGIALRRAALELIVVACAMLSVFLAADRLAVTRLAAWLFAATVAINLAFVVASPVGRLGGALGLYAQKNILGVVMTAAVYFTLWGAVDARGLKRALFVVVALAAAAILISSKSKTSIGLALLCPLAALGVVGLSRALRVHAFLLLLMLIVGIALLVTAFFAISGQGVASLTTLLFGDPTFTGRTDIWSFVLDAHRRHPIVGFGFGSFWGAGEHSLVAQEAPGFIRGLLQAHDGYLDILVQLGYVGLALLVVTIVVAFQQIQPAARRPGRTEWLILTVLLFVTLDNGLESSWFRGFATQWLAFLFVTALAIADRATDQISHRPTLRVISRGI